MSREKFNKRKNQFIETITKIQRLPKVGEFKFYDGEDMRIWLNKISKIEQFIDFINEINSILKKYNIKVLTDKEKEEEFFNCISELKRIPMNNEIYFSDNDDMFTWYMNYKKRNPDFETIVYICLPEYIDFDLVTVWPLIKKEFTVIIKQLKRVPEQGEVILQNNIDVRVVFDKLKSHDPNFFEELLLHLQTYNEKGLTIDNRVQELKNTVSRLGYIPELQEVRFSDGTDMFTWYMRYKNILPNLEKELSELVFTKIPNKKVNIYLIPNFRKDTGKFYTICTNVGERLDLSLINSFEDAQRLDTTIAKRGELVLEADEEIEFISFKKGKTK